MNFCTSKGVGRSLDVEVTAESQRDGSNSPTYLKVDTTCPKFWKGAYINLTAMTSTIGTRSIQYQSIFSSSESHASTNTEWTFEPSIKLGDDGNDVRSKGQEKRISPRGRPSNGWTSRSLRRLIRLYLLTDLDLDCIIDRLKTEDFQPW